MPHVSSDSIDILNELQAEVRYAYGECFIDNDKIIYSSEPAEDMSNEDQRQTLENLLDHVADILDEYKDFEE
jgi:hypothetical protein